MPRPLGDLVDTVCEYLAAAEKADAATAAAAREGAQSQAKEKARVTMKAAKEAAAAAAHALDRAAAQHADVLDKHVAQLSRFVDKTPAGLLRYLHSQGLLPRKSTLSQVLEKLGVEASSPMEGVWDFLTPDGTPDDPFVMSYPRLFDCYHFFGDAAALRSLQESIRARPSKQRIAAPRFRITSFDGKTPARFCRRSLEGVVRIQQAGVGSHAEPVGNGERGESRKGAARSARGLERDLIQILL